MVNTITQEIDVDAPVRAVFDQWAKLEEFPRFMSVVESIQAIGENRSHWVVNVGGVRREFDATTIAVVPDERIAWESDGEKLHTGLVSFTPLGADRTHIEVQMAWVPESFTEKAGAALGIDDMAVKRDLHRFKELMEGDLDPDGQDSSDGPTEREKREDAQRRDDARGVDPDIGLGL